jgi:SAM-dependent methyltransferase
MTPSPACSSCGAPLAHVALDLGMSPLSNALVDAAHLGEPDPLYPLRAYICDRCWLLQVPQVASPAEIFGDYPYFSSVSSTWRNHLRAYAGAIISRLGLGPGDLVVELASNDGVLLKEFQARSIPVLGIEPAGNVAAAARAEGTPTISEFFGATLAKRIRSQRRGADLIVANNVLAHVPDVNDFVHGIGLLLTPSGTATVEFPHLLRTIERAEFDTIYHEHFSYFSLSTADAIFRRHGLRVVDVDELPTHGGSLRIYVRHAEGAVPTGAVARIVDAERAAGLFSLQGYASLQENAEKVKRDLVKFLTGAKSSGKRVAGYGAPAKATTLLNFCGIGAGLLPYTVDRSPHKQGRLIPGVRVPIHAPERIFETKPDYVLILPWNIAGEVREEMAGIGAWGGRFAVAIPALSVMPALESMAR